MANNVKIKNIKITLDGADHELVYNMNAMCKIEEKYGDVETAFGKLEGSSKVFSSLRFLLWAGMIHENEKITLQDVGKMINFLDIDKVEQLVNSLNDAINKDENKNMLKKK